MKIYRYENEIKKSKSETRYWQKLSNAIDSVEKDTIKYFKEVDGVDLELNKWEILDSLKEVALYFIEKSDMIVYIKLYIDIIETED